jgi:D-3-phosphoglycerate dehydrogenase
MKTVVVGDLFVSPDKLEEAAKKLPFKDNSIVKMEWKVKDKEEFQRKILSIEEHGPEAEPFPDVLLYEVQDADLLLVHFAPVPSKVIEAAQKLKLIGCCRGGLENIDIGTASKRGIPVIHVIRNAEAVAEFTVGLILCETRNIARSYEALKKGFWMKDFVNSDFLSTLKGKTVGIVGLGNIGKLVAKEISVFGVSLLGYDPFVSEEGLANMGIKIKMVALEKLFKESDIITLHLRLAPETKTIVNRHLISLMKPTGYLINSARAELIEENALYDALLEKRIMGAALDVFWEEPLPPNHHIIKLDNVTLTSHLAGTTVDAITNSPFLLVETIKDYLDGNIWSDLVVNAKQINIKAGFEALKSLA